MEGGRHRAAVGITSGPDMRRVRRGPGARPALVDQEILQQELALTAFKGAAAAAAGDLQGVGRSLDLDHLMGGAAMRAVHSERCRIGHEGY